MTQELDKEGLEAAEISLQNSEGLINVARAEMAIQAYLNTPKVTGFYELLGDCLKYVNSNCGCKTMAMMCFMECKASHLSTRLQAALAGGNTK